VQTTVAFHSGSGGKPAARAKCTTARFQVLLFLALTRQWLLLAVLIDGSPGISIFRE
jgi:hypothetical protein